MLGVIKLLDPKGRMVDQVPYFGSISPLTFGRVEKPYILDSAIFVDGSGVRQHICDFYGVLGVGDMPKINFTAERIIADGFIPPKKKSFFPWRW